MSNLDEIFADKFLMTPDAFTAALATARGWAELELAGKPESMAPTLTVHSITLEAKQEVTLCSLFVPFNEHAEKRQALADLGAKFYQDQKFPQAVFLCTEAWLAQNPPPGLQPRDCPDRREVLLVFGMSFGGKSKAVVSIPVRRDGENRMLRDGEATETREGQSVILNAFYAGFVSQFTNAPRGAP